MKYFFAESIVKDQLNLPQTSADANTMGTIVQFTFAVIAAVSILVIVIAGFQLVISSGEPDKIAKARRTILYAVIGLIVAASAFTIVSFVVRRV